MGEPDSLSAMRITHFAKYYPPESGGIESVTQILARGHAAMGHEVDVVCFTRAAARTEVLDGVRVHRLPIQFFFASQPLGWRYAVKALTLGRRSDVVHAHAPNLVAAFLTLIVGRRPCVVVHWHSDVIKKGWLGRLVRPLERAFLRRADAVIATSAAYVAGSDRLISVQEKTHVIPIGIEAPATDDRAAALAPDLVEFLQGRRLVLGVGRLVPYKGFQHLIEAAGSLSLDAAIVIAGDGPMKSALAGEIDRRGLQRRVRLAGKVSETDLHALFARASVFCLPSLERSEAFGVVLLEAMAWGVPIVATCIEGSGTSWVNAELVSGLNVAPADASALAQACNRILDEPALGTMLGTGGRQRFRDVFTASEFVRSVDELYRGLRASTQSDATNER